ncbi:MAG: hypothetical protein K2J80_05425 [Oscillospiraceae bacterium]|nr:hypothetical protein [Oscillospiraceae bacterium]
MPLLEKLKNFFAPKWEPLVCRPADIIDLFKQDIATGAPLEDLTVDINGKPHHVGISSDYDKGVFFDTYFFLDDQCFKTLEGFVKKASVDGVLFSELETIKILCENLYSGDPRSSVLLSQREIK